MAVRVGYTADIEITKFDLENKFKNTRNWKVTPPFPSKKEAQEWEEKVSVEMKCKAQGPGQAPRKAHDKWVGYSFEHDGPK